jgi:hypothetical protein
MNLLDLSECQSILPFYSWQISTFVLFDQLGVKSSAPVASMIILGNGKWNTLFPIVPFHHLDEHHLVSWIVQMDLL